MCFVVGHFYSEKEARNYKPKIAETNIVVYKKLIEDDDGTLISPYRGFKYEMNELCQIKRFGKKITFHNKLWYLDIHRGLHSYIEKGQSTFYLYSAIVPKGSLYYSNSREIVSNQLIIKRKCV